MATDHDALDKAVQLLGGVTAAALRLNVKSYQSIQQWRSTCVPIERCPIVEREVAGAITCEDLRPDVSWVRVADKSWPHPKGRPLVDHSQKVAA